MANNNTIMPSKAQGGRTCVHLAKQIYGPKSKVQQRQQQADSLDLGRAYNTTSQQKAIRQPPILIPATVYHSQSSANTYYVRNESVKMAR